jgi:Tol biopolymer transport system component
MQRYIAGVLALAAVAAIASPAGATPAGHNGLVVWQVWPREAFIGLSHLRIANPDGSGQRAVFATARNRGELEATFSPTDPNVMFFSRGSKAPFSEDIYSGNLATGTVNRVTTARSADIGATVFANGMRIVYFAIPRPRHFDPNVPPPPERIHAANLDGSGDRVLTPANQRSFDPDPSPDGTRIVYAQTRDVPPHPQNRLVIMNADGTGRRALTAFGGPDELNPKWMPNGQEIVFERARPRGTRSDIFAISPNGGALRPILSTPAWETNPIPSPDGTRILFTSDRNRRGRDRLGPGFEVYTMAVNGSDIVRLTNNRRPDLFPDWQRLP